MRFKESPTQFQIIDIALIEPDPGAARQGVDEGSLKGLANSIGKKGLIHPLVVQPANAAGKHTLIVGERRWRAAMLAGETTVPALIHACDPTEALEIQVFENLGLGVRAALEPRDMANAIQRIAASFESQEAAAEHFARTPTWLTQATAAANLSPKVTALLDSGKIGSTGAAVQLEKLVQKNEAKAESLIDQIEQLPEGEKLGSKVVANALSEEGGRRKKKAETTPEAAPADPRPATAAADIPPWEDLPAAPAAQPAPANRRVNAGKVRMVAEILGLSDENEDEILDRLIDEFLAMKGEASASTE